MAVLGKLLKNRRAGEARLAWNTPNLGGPETLTVASSDFADEATIPVVHASKRIGGQDRSPSLTWSAAPDGTAQLLLVVEDPDAPTATPFVHCVALVDPAVAGLEAGALDATNAAAGVRVLRSGVGRGYQGPAPIKGHGPHRYVFQLFALAEPIPGGAALDSARPRDVLAAAGGVLARGRLDGLYERTWPARGRPGSTSASRSGRAPEVVRRLVRTHLAGTGAARLNVSFQVRPRTGGRPWKGGIGCA